MRERESYFRTFFTCERKGGVRSQGVRTSRVCVMRER